jgi:excisionase family DNA binding protein
MDKEIILLSLTKDELDHIVTSAVESVLNKKTKKELMNFKEVCEYLNVHPSTLNSWKSKGMVPYKRLGKRIFFQREEILAALKSINHKKLNKLKQLP